MHPPHLGPFPSPASTCLTQDRAIPTILNRRHPNNPAKLFDVNHPEGEMHSSPVAIVRTGYPHRASPSREGQAFPPPRLIRPLIQRAVSLNSKRSCPGQPLIVPVGQLTFLVVSKTWTIFLQRIPRHIADARSQRDAEAYHGDVLISLTSAGAFGEVCKKATRDGLADVYFLSSFFKATVFRDIPNTSSPSTDSGVTRVRPVSTHFSFPS